MRHLNHGLARRRVRKAESQSEWRKGQQITVAGVVLTRQRPMTANGVVFVTLEDETGVINLVLYSTVFDKYELVAKYAGIMLARGRVDRRGEVVHVRANHIERLDMPAGSGQPDADHKPTAGADSKLALRSRDFH